MFIAGLTGGAGSGKSTFRKIFCECSAAAFLDVDEVVRQLLQADAGVRQAIENQLSSRAYDSGGCPDRAWLRELIYHQPEARETLESILHPAVRIAWRRAVAESRKAGRSLIVEIPLLFEKNLEAGFDCSILVAATPQTQLQRLAERGLDSAVARRMLAAQLPNEEKIPRASHVIWNDGSLDFLHAQAERLAHQFHRIYGN
ncbi:MAG TPA: dephospho-CoA kinase [Chthoniobacterales bacterium]